MCNARDAAGTCSLILGSGRSPGEGNGNPLQCSCLGNPMDRGAWWATVNGVAKESESDLVTKCTRSKILQTLCSYVTRCRVDRLSEDVTGDSPGGPVVENPPSNAGDAGLIPGWGTKIPHAVGHLSLCLATPEPAHSRACAPRQEEPGCHSEDPTQPKKDLTRQNL